MERSAGSRRRSFANLEDEGKQTNTNVTDAHIWEEEIENYNSSIE